MIDTDASETALGAVLSQIIDGEERPLAFESRVLSKTEVNYATTKREALGIVQAMQWFQSLHLRVAMYSPDRSREPSMAI